MCESHKYCQPLTPNILVQSSIILHHYQNVTDLNPAPASPFHFPAATAQRLVAQYSIKSYPKWENTILDRGLRLSLNCYNSCFLVTIFFLSLISFILLTHWPSPNPRPANSPQKQRLVAQEFFQSLPASWGDEMSGKSSMTRALLATVTSFILLANNSQALLTCNHT